MYLARVEEERRAGVINLVLRSSPTSMLKNLLSQKHKKMGQRQTYKHIKSGDV